MLSSNMVKSGLSNSMKWLEHGAIEAKAVGSIPVNSVNGDFWGFFCSLHSSACVWFHEIPLLKTNCFYKGGGDSLYKWGYFHFLLIP